MEDTGQHKALLERVVNTSDALIQLLAPTVRNQIASDVKRIASRYKELDKTARGQFSRLETTLKRSDEVRLILFYSYLIHRAI